MIEFISVCRTVDVPNGEGKSFDIGKRTIAIFNRNGSFSAIDDLCPHMGASMSEGHFDTDACTVACPWHGWRFDVRDGAWADNPRIKTDVFELRIVGDEIQVGMPAARPGKTTTDGNLDDKKYDEESK